MLESDTKSLRERGGMLQGKPRPWLSQADPGPLQGSHQDTVWCVLRGPARRDVSLKDGKYTLYTGHHGTHLLGSVLITNLSANHISPGALQVTQTSDLRQG